MKIARHRKEPAPSAATSTRARPPAAGCLRLALGPSRRGATRDVTLTLTDAGRRRSGDATVITVSRGESAQPSLTLTTRGVPTGGSSSSAAPILLTPMAPAWWTPQVPSTSPGLSTSIVRRGLGFLPLEFGKPAHGTYTEGGDQPAGIEISVAISPSPWWTRPRGRAPQPPLDRNA